MLRGSGNVLFAKNGGFDKSVSNGLSYEVAQMNLVAQSDAAVFGEPELSRLTRERSPPAEALALPHNVLLQILWFPSPWCQIPGLGRAG